RRSLLRQPGGAGRLRVHRHFRRTDRRRRGDCVRRGEGRAFARDFRGHGEQGDARRAWFRARDPGRAVGRGIPVIKTLRESLAGNAIQRVSGIFNGTCNYILSRMETERLPFDVCLREAQALGYAEADPAFDIGGFDTAHKLAIVASLAFGAKVDTGAVSVEG